MEQASAAGWWPPCVARNKCAGAGGIALIDQRLLLPPPAPHPPTPESTNIRTKHRATLTATASCPEPNVIIPGARKSLVGAPRSPGKRRLRGK
ncbi:hypothetical protein JYU34_003178 [Plutella xylostella]|uniref:Uncharacterized protein n=1 Tax=Plutella xylostella TaxID=51655 RepID=A0ABQ7PPG2_PLUXY|nr:hypothetical protein JYU34_022737 [Plutella xylostella]KAG7310403.1 hypothetical protein JYU34_003178 [Plutella xylostella]